jgi:hypothetical protein
MEGNVVFEGLFEGSFLCVDYFMGEDINYNQSYQTGYAFCESLLYV